MVPAAFLSAQVIVNDRILRLNATLGGRYTIDRELGQGGMAVVYLAEQHHPVRRTICQPRSRRTAVRVSTASYSSHPTSGLCPM